MKWCVALALCAACVKIPAFQGGDGGGSQHDAAIDAPPASPCPTTTFTLSHANAGGHEYVCGPGFAMRFAATGARLPDSFLVGGHEVLAAASPAIPACEAHRDVGIALEPLGYVVPGDDTGNLAITGAPITYSIDSEFLVKLSVPWSVAAAPALATACAQTVTGATDFVFSVDGHITRHDHIAGAAQASALACSTTCDSASMWNVGAFFTFAQTSGESISHFGALPAAGADPVIIDEEHDHYATCITSPDGTMLGVGYSWDYNDIVATLANETSAWTLVHRTSLGSAVGITDTRQIFKVGATGLACTDLEGELEKLGLRQATVTLATNEDYETGGTAYGLAQGDGIYGGDLDGTTSPGAPIPSPARIVPLGGRSLPAGSAIWAHYASPHTAFAVTLGIAPATDDISATVFHTVPLGRPNDVVFYFTHEVMPGADLTITALD